MFHVFHVRLSSRACISNAKSCMNEFAGLYFMYDSVRGPRSSTSLDVTQFTGLHFSMLIQVRLSSRAYM